MRSPLRDNLAKLWQAGQAEEALQLFHDPSGIEADDLLLAMTFDQRRRWETCSPFRVYDYVAAIPWLQDRYELQVELVRAEFDARKSAGYLVSSRDFLAEYPQFKSELREHLSETDDRHDTDSVPSIDIDQLCDEFEEQWVAGETPSLSRLLAACPRAQQVHLLQQVLRIEIHWRKKRGQVPTRGEFLDRLPDWPQQIYEAFEAEERDETDLAGECNSAAAAADSFISDRTVGDTVGRYRLNRILGRGGFGTVYLAFDEELHRQVAIKVPDEKYRNTNSSDAWFAEARIAAGINHPNVVPVYDVNRTADGAVYIVSRYINGDTLRDRIRECRPAHALTAQILAGVAAGLHHAHQQRLLHRDVKPANILLDADSDTPYVTDFGLAIREEDFLRTGSIAGTPAYMSPEQSRGEGHRLDRRSDIFALGVVMYEMLTGVKPFLGDTIDETLQNVRTHSPKTPRQLVPTLPTELERICLKAISKRAQDRYDTAAEMEQDLRLWEDTHIAIPAGEQAVVPRGLRPFSKEDAGFFLQLLPGGIDRNGLPESVSFWKSRIEETDPHETFDVGLLYGPSGCGKSSLVRAGLLPSLATEITAVYVEATPEETEQRILTQLERSFPQWCEAGTLLDALTLIRRRHERKVLIVIDQFEQWLHANRTVAEQPLVAALRQCDGARLQAIVLVRDDFSMEATRFMRELETRIVEGHNFSTVDLFDPDHARQTLIRFGRAFGRLPEAPRELSSQQQQFVDTVVEGLANDGKIVCVRLALFAEMVKRRDWIPATLKEVGGTSGVGVNFLDEAFGRGQGGNPEHRLHASAARKVLRVLLPEKGADIKGHMQSRDQLLHVSGYATRDAEFRTLLQILDSDLRLITPVGDDDRQADALAMPSLSFQLTHDYLVPSLREWLTRTQRETYTGRAELTLAERHAEWKRDQDNRRLPSPFETLRIVTMTRRSQWKSSERQMIRRASLRHFTRGTVLVLLLACIPIAASVTRQIAEAQSRQSLEESFLETLIVADASSLDPLIDEVASKRHTPAQHQLAEDLRQIVARESPESNGHRNAALALCVLNGSEYAAQALTVAIDRANAKPETLQSLVQYLAPTNPDTALTEALWKARVLEEANVLPIASCLARLQPQSTDWGDTAFLDRIVVSLADANEKDAERWMENLQPIKQRLVRPTRLRFASSDAPLQRQRLCRLFSRLSDADSKLDYLAPMIGSSQPEEFELLVEPLNSRFDKKGAIASDLKNKLQSTTIYDPPERVRGLTSTELSPDFINLIDSCHGTVEENTVWFIEMRADYFSESGESILRESGFEAQRVRPYRMGNEVLVAAVFHRDAAQTESALDLTLAELQEFNQDYTDKGFDPVDCAVYVGSAEVKSGNRYAAVWKKNSDTEQGNSSSRLVAGVTLAQLAELTGDSSVRSLTGAHLEGQERFCATLRSDVQEMPTGYDQGASLNEAEDNAVSRTLTDVSIRQRSEVNGNNPSLQLGEACLLAFPWTTAKLGSREQSKVVLATTAGELKQKITRLKRYGFGVVSLGGSRDGKAYAALLNCTIPSQDEVSIRAAARARFAIAVARLGDGSIVRQLLEDDTDRQTQTQLIYSMQPYGLPADNIVTILERTGELTSKPVLARAALLAAGQYTLDDNLAEKVAQLVVQLRQSARHASVVSAADWLLDRISPEPIPLENENQESLADSDWRLASDGSRMISIKGPVRFLSRTQLSNSVPPPGYQAAPLSVIRIDRSFSVSSSEITENRFRAFFKDVFDGGRLTQPDESIPQQAVMRWAAAAYCRWLSDKEGIPEDQMCYPPLTAEDWSLSTDGQIKTADDFLDRTGFRLPTRLEWEYILHAGSDRAPFGPFSTESLQNEAGTKLGAAVNSLSDDAPFPNHLGFIKTAQDAGNWLFGGIAPDRRADLIASSSEIRLMSTDQPRFNRSRSIIEQHGFLVHDRDGGDSTDRVGTTIGFRIARTIVPSGED